MSSDIHKAPKTETTTQAIIGFFFGNTFLYIVNFFFSMVRLKVYSVEDFGFWRLSQSLAPIAVTISLLGLPLYLLITIPKLEAQSLIQKLKPLLKNSFLLVFFTNVVVVILSLIAWQSNIFGDSMSIPFKYLPLFVMSMSFKGVLDYVFIALRQSILLIKINILDIVLMSVISVGIYLIFKSISLVIWCVAAEMAFFCLIRVILIVKKLPVQRGEYEVDGDYSLQRLFRKSHEYGRWNIPTNLMWIGYTSIPLWLASYNGLKAAAHVGFALNMVNISLTPFAQISDILLQNLSRKCGGILDSIKREASKHQNMLLPVIVMLLSSYTISIIGLINIFFDKYRETIPYIQILMPSTLFLLLLYLMKNVPTSMEKIKHANIPEFFGFAFLGIVIFSLRDFGGIQGIFWALLLTRFALIIFARLIYQKYGVLSLRWLPFLTLQIPVILLYYYGWVSLLLYPIILGALLVWQRETFNMYWSIGKRELMRICSPFLNVRYEG